MNFKKIKIFYHRPIKVKTISRQIQNLIDAIYGKKFLTTTLSYATIANWLVKHLFWTAIYLFGFYFTIQSVIEIVATYQDKPSVFILENIHINDHDNISFPNITVCMPQSYMGFENQASMINLATYSQQIIDTFFNNNTINGTFSVSSDLLFSDEIYLLVWKYLAMIYEGEHLIESRQNPYVNWQSQKDGIESAVLNTFAAKVSALNISIDQLKNVFDGILKCFYYIWKSKENALEYGYLYPYAYASSYSDYNNSMREFIPVSYFTKVPIL